jgi:hypothetical protein
MKLRIKLFSVLSILAIAGCATTVDQVAAVKNRASFDFTCDPAKIQVTLLQMGTYGAEGCKYKQVYTVQGTMVYREGAAPDPVYVQPVGIGVGYHRYYR